MMDTFGRVCQKFPTLSFSAQKAVADFCNEEIADRNAPFPWNAYRRRVVEHIKKVGLKATVEKTGLGKTTLYRWRKELS